MNSDGILIMFQRLSIPKSQRLLKEHFFRFKFPHEGENWPNYFIPPTLDVASIIFIDH